MIASYDCFNYQEKFLTVHSFVEVAKFLLSTNEGGDLFLLSERFSQDPLENYFGQQRARGGRSDNPTIQHSLHNASALRVQKSMALDPIRGNCHRKRRLFKDKDQEAIVAEAGSKPLPKRSRIKSKSKNTRKNAKKSK